MLKQTNKQNKTNRLSTIVRVHNQLPMIVCAGLKVPLGNFQANE
jgi:hypothetical protein